MCVIRWVSGDCQKVFFTLILPTGAEILKKGRGRFVISVTNESARTGDGVMHPAHNRTFLAAALPICLLLSLYGCSRGPFFHPPGERIASCSGTLRGSDGTMAFTVMAYRSDDGGCTLHAHIPRKRIRFAAVGDISIDDGIVTIELTKPHVTVSGRVTGDPLTFEGKWEGVSGALTLRLDN